jgi:hypothetical protein
MSWKQPVREVLFTDSWARELMEVDHDKPTAMGTPFRYSGALNCGRRMIFDALGIEQTDPIDPAGIHVTTMGTYIHERVQDAIGRRYPGARFEVKSQIGTTSGSADGVFDEETILFVVVHWDGGKVLYELKTVGGFAFDKAIGLNRKAYKQADPKGPRPSAIVQAGLNALANGCETVIVGYIGMESVSKGLAEKLDLGPFERFIAEWHIPREVWEPMAQAELQRIDLLTTYLEEKEIPDGTAFDDEKEEWIPVSPNAARPHWTCQYCPHLTTCLAHEAGVDVLPLEVAKGAPALSA